MNPVFLAPMDWRLTNLDETYRSKISRIQCSLVRIMRFKPDNELNERWQFLKKNGELSTSW